MLYILFYCCRSKLGKHDWGPERPRGETWVFEIKNYIQVVLGKLRLAMETFSFEFFFNHVQGKGDRSQVDTFKWSTSSEERSNL